MKDLDDDDKKAVTEDLLVSYVKCFQQKEATACQGSIIKSGAPGHIRY